MKKSMKYWALALCPVLFALSCEKDENLVEDNDQLEKTYRTITFEFPEDPETRVSLAADGKTAWEPGDQIFIHGQKVGEKDTKAYSRIITLNAENIHDSGKTATFTMEDIIVTEGWRETGYVANLFAAYPASAIADYSGGDSWYYSTGFNQTDVLLLAGCNDKTVNEGNTFTFKNISGVLSFVVDGDFDSYVFSGNGDETVSYDVFSVRVDAQSSFDDKKGYIPYSGSSGGIGTSGPRTAVSGSVVADGTTVNHIFFPGGVNLTNGFTINFLKEGNILKILSTHTPKDIAMGKYLKLGDVTSHLKNPAAHVLASWTAGAEDLGASETANCYIVYDKDVVAANAGKAFKIPAVKGNSSVSVGSVGGVSIIWETYCNGTAVAANTVVADVDYDEDYIYFRMPEAGSMQSGNALIAAKDGSDNILWSWHIWVPSSEIETITDVDFVNAASGQIMDRNLGALEPALAAESAVPTTAFGLYYQWGRKDPFLTSDWTRNATVPFSTSSTWVTTETAIQNPTVFYKKQDATTDPKTYNWNSSEITTLWEDGGKTVYDPCPSGYRVDVYNSSKRLWKYSDTSGWEANTTYGWLKYGTVVFPLSGYTETLGSYKVKERALVWSASYKSLERASALYTNPLPNYNSYYKYHGASVRCVKE